MVSDYREIDEDIINQMYNYEYKLCEELNTIFINKYEDFLNKYNLHTDIYVSRWIDKTGRNPRKYYDGFSSMLCVDFKDSDNSVIELDENLCSVDDYITNIYYLTFKRKYRVYMKDNLEELEELWSDIEKTINLIIEFMKPENE